MAGVRSQKIDVVGGDEWPTTQPTDTDHIARLALICVTVGSMLCFKPDGNSMGKVQTDPGTGYIKAKAALTFLIYAVTHDEYIRFTHALVARKSNRNKDGKPIQVPHSLARLQEVDSLQTLHNIFTAEDIAAALVIGLNVR